MWLASAGMIALALVLCACVTSAPTGFSRDAPAAIYPGGELSGPPTWFVGWKWKFAKPPLSSEFDKWLSVGVVEPVSHN